MARALRFLVPLKAICSSRWEMPIWLGFSLRLPVLTQMPRAALSSWLMGSLTTVKPLESLDISRVMAPNFSGDQSREDEVLYQRRGIGHGLDPFGQLSQGRQGCRFRRRDTDRLGHGLREFGGMGGGENDHGRCGPAHLQSGRHADRCVRIDNASLQLVDRGDGGLGVLVAAGKG